MFRYLSHTSEAVIAVANSTLRSSSVTTLRSASYSCGVIGFGPSGSFNLGVCRLDCLRSSLFFLGPPLLRGASGFLNSDLSEFNDDALK